MKVNLFFTYSCYLLILIWMFIPETLFFRLIVILFIIAMTLESTKPKEKKVKK